MKINAHHITRSDNVSIHRDHRHRTTIIINIGTTQT